MYVSDDNDDNDKESKNEFDSMQQFHVNNYNLDLHHTKDSTSSNDDDNYYKYV